MSLQPPAKHRWAQFSIAEKKEIVTYKNDHPKAAQDEIAAHLALQWGKQDQQINRQGHSVI